VTYDAGSFPRAHAAASPPAHADSTSESKAGVGVEGVLGHPTWLRRWIANWSETTGALHSMISDIFTSSQ
jgi:hypothetical protein